MVKPSKEEIKVVLEHWTEANLEKNLRKLELEILKLKLTGGSMGLIQKLQQEYDKIKAELDVLQSKDKKNVDGHPVQQIHKGEG